MPSREREDIEWREGFRAGREAAQKREAEERKRSAVPPIKVEMVESQPKANVPEILITAATPTKGTAPKPATVEAEVNVQPPMQRTVSAPQPNPSPSASAPTPVSNTAAAPSKAPPAPFQEQEQPRNPPKNQQHHHHHHQDQPYTYEHRRFYRGGRRHSPSSSSDSASSRSLRGLRRRLSNIWAHVSGLERWAMDEDTRARQARQNREREQREVEMRRRASENEAADEARRRRRMGLQEVRFEDEGWRARRPRGASAGPMAAPLQPRKRGRVQQVVIVDERDRREPRAAAASSRWTWERRL